MSSDTPTPPPSGATTPVSGVYVKIYSEIMADKTLLPTMPEVAVRMRAAMNDPAYDVGSIARIVQADAGISAYLVRMANSALFRGTAPSTDVPAAVMRLGMNLTRNVVIAHSLRSMFRVKSGPLAQVMHATWERSARLAALSAVLSKRSGAFSPDRALLAGLLQDIGALPILNAFERRRDEPPTIERINATIEELAAKVGATLLHHWGFDEEMVEVARSRNQWFRDSGGRADLADLVLIARLHTCLGTPQQSRCPRIDHVPAFGKLQLGTLKPDDSLAVLAEADAEVREVTEMLGV
jgi:HD-like signal output (HDOD) protein